MQIVNPFYHARIATSRHTGGYSSAYNVLDLFSGIGGFALGLEKAGMNTVAFCEIDTFCQHVLSRHWPKIPIYQDVKQLTARRLNHDGICSIDIICGGYGR
jgi:DNA (cytosine-5)-methyltransferase 1